MDRPDALTRPTLEADTRRSRPGRDGRAAAAAAGFTKGAVSSHFASKDELVLALLGDSSARRVEAVEAALARARDVPEALAAVAAELGRPDAAGHLLLVEFWQRAVFDPGVREAFVRSRRALRARVAEAAAAFLAAHPPREGRSWEPEELAVVLVALADGLALEGLPDPTAVPQGLTTLVLEKLVL